MTKNIKRKKGMNRYRSPSSPVGELVAMVKLKLCNGGDEVIYT